MTCEECQELLLLYVTGALEPAEAAGVRAHLATGCAACAGELAAAEATLHKVPLGLPLERAPESAWEKLETRIALREQVEGHGPDRAALAAPFVPRKSPLGWLGWAAAAAIAVAGGLAWKSASDENAKNRDEIRRLTSAVEGANDLRTRVVTLENQIKTLSEQNVTQLAINQTLSSDIQEKIDELLHSDQFAVTSPEQPGAGGKLYWNRQKQTWQIYLENVRPAEAGKTYELWIVAGENKLAAGTAQVDDKGRLFFKTTRRLPEGITLAAITDEAAAGEPDNGAKGKVHFVAKLTN